MHNDLLSGGSLSVLFGTKESKMNKLYRLSGKLSVTEDQYYKLQKDLEKYGWVEEDTSHKSRAGAYKLYKLEGKRFAYQLRIIVFCKGSRCEIHGRHLKKIVTGDFAPPVLWLQAPESVDAYDESILSISQNQVMLTAKSSNATISYPIESSTWLSDWIQTALELRNQIKNTGRWMETSEDLYRPTLKEGQA